MNYLHAFLEAEKARSQKAKAYPEDTAKPAKLGSAGFAGSQNHTLTENETDDPDPLQSGKPCLEDPAKPAKLPPTDVLPVSPVTETILSQKVESPPPASCWRELVAPWPIERRQAWADQAEALQVEGLPWDRAERQSFLEIAEPGDLTRAGPPRRSGDPIPFPRFDTLPELADIARAEEEVNRVSPAD
jgi:hypothetical protein